MKKILVICLCVVMALSMVACGNTQTTKENVKFSWSDASASATLDGSAYTNGSSISVEGAHTIVLTDAAGNSTSYTFAIDKTAPTGTLIGVTDKGNFRNTGLFPAISGNIAFSCHIFQTAFELSDSFFNVTTI